MKLLIVSSTWNEIKPLEEYLLKKDEEKIFREHSIELLVTGVGGAATAFHLGKMLPIDNWDLVIQLGICGSFNGDISIGATVNVIADCFADLGAEDDEAFLDVFDLGLMERDTFPFKNGWLHWHHEIKSEILATLFSAKSVSVNKVSGNEISVQKMISKYHPDVESMEGAAFMFCCLRESIPFIQLRTVSNYVEKRDRSKWNIPFAIKNLNETAIRILEEQLLSKLF